MLKTGFMSQANTQAADQNQIKNSQTAGLNSKAIKLAAKKSTEEPKKSVWHSVFYGLAVGALSFLMKFLPEKIGNFLSKIIPPVFKTDSPFEPE